MIDWNDATQGSPSADIVRTLLLLQQGEPSHPLKLEQTQLRSVRNVFINTYLRRYTQIRSISIEDVNSWRLPIAAARLSEDIKEEEGRLLAIVETLLTRTK